ncbi:MAG TPA: ABC transporter permease [Bryobacteraceae bacterium]|jgi:predicted permease|nr:ABC transporter permease [Bryobacteraceae bacterium]
MHDWRRLVRERLPGAESALVDELAEHLEDHYREQLSGVGEQEAYRCTLSELNEIYPLRRSERMPKERRLRIGDDLWRDFRFALRTMRKNPLFVLFVVLTLALGIGANTTVFTVINTLILNPLPVHDPGRLAAIGIEGLRSGPPKPLSYADLEDYRNKNQVFSSVAGYTSPRVVTLQAAGGTERVFCELATADYFSTLGLNPVRGGFFTPDEKRFVAVLNYGTWQGRFGGAADIVGRTLRLNNEVFTVVGVAPEHFIGVNGIMGPDVWVPAALTEELLPNEMQNALHDREKGIFQGIGRLKPGVSRAEAQANLTTIASALARAYPATNENRTVAVRSIGDVLFAGANTGGSAVVFAGAMLLIVVGVVLLIACSNVANLLMARAAARRQEMAVRLAMGASRRRLVRQLLTESVLLGVLSGAVGLLMGYAGLQLLFGMLPSASNFIVPKFDATVFIFALLVSLSTGFVFGIIPALKATREDVGETLKEEARTTGRGRKRVTLGNSLLVGQVAFSFLLLMTAALFLRSIQRAYNIDPGFQTAHLATFMTNPGQAGYGKAQTKAFYKDARERVMRLPAVASASWSSNLPLWGRTVNGLQVEGREQTPKVEKISSILSTVDLDYFETAGVTIDRGRGFTNLDQEKSSPVAIVNEKVAHDFWPGGDALGKRIQLPGDKQMRQIVGVARNASYTSWAEPPQFCVYVPLEQNYSDAMTMYVRSKGDPKDLLLPVPREIQAAAPQILVSGARTGEELVNGGLFQARIGVTLLGVFGLLALGLASIGLYGILAYSVNQRKREIGLRMALGAAQGSVLRLILKQGMSLVLTGIAIGLAASLFVDRLLSGMLYGVSSSDPVSVFGAVALLVGVALVACYLPARWASRVDPLVALREG